MRQKYATMIEYFLVEYKKRSKEKQEIHADPRERFIATGFMLAIVMYSLCFIQFQTFRSFLYISNITKSGKDI